ncbi:MAG TPA: Smr/MutS family protein [Saprospiraceae bacterium]|nr:Smr/MutS family protein [Saprospiraceae bacterium]
MKKVDIWIGDKVILIKSGRRGIIQKIDKNDKIAVKVDHKIVNTSLENIQIIEEKSDNKFSDIDDWIAKEEKIKSTTAKTTKINHNKPNNTLDLHLEKLDTKGKIIMDQNILEFKMTYFKKWFEERYSKKIICVTVIHGKGTGTLKNVLETWLRSDPRVAFINTKNDGGAMEIWFKY